MATALLSDLNDPRAPKFFARFELALLAELGFGLDLERCAATGATRRPDLRLAKNRPRREPAKPAPPGRKTLALPSFLHDSQKTPATPEDIRAALRLTGFFLDRDLFFPRGLKPPDSRAAYMAGL